MVSTHSLFRWGGGLLVLTAILFGVGGALVALQADGGLGNIAAPILYYLGLVLSTPAFTALYGVQARQTGRMGLVGYALAVIGAILYSAPAFVLVAGAAGVAEWHSIWGFAMGNVLLIGPGLFFLGSILLGVATRRAGVLPGWAGLLLAIGSATWLIAYYPSLPLVLVVANLVAGAGMAWAGWVMWSGRQGTVDLELGTPSADPLLP